MQGGFCGEMGKAGRWLRSFLLGKKEKKAVDFSAVSFSPALKEKRRWSFQRPAVAGKGLNSADLASPQLMRQLSESEIDKRRTMAITTVMADAAGAIEGAVEAGRTIRTANWTIMEVAAIKIQSIFRSYLARKALCALRGLVKLQAMVRGHLVRKQATLAFRCMQSLVMAQARARAHRMRMVKPKYNSSQRQPIHKTPHIQKSYTKEKNRNAKEDVKIVEMDHGEPSASLESRLAAYYYGVQDQYQQFTPAPSGFEEFSLTKQSSSPQHLSAASVSNATQASFGPSCPSYMANTESSRAKARSHSAPKQRPDLYERHLSSRRASAEGRSVSRGAKMQRSSSQASPRSIKLDQSSMTVKDSECGSTSTKLTSTNYSRSLVAYEVPI